MFSLKNKTAVITGAASGIGRAIASVFSKQGATVHLLDMNEEALGIAVKEIESAGGKAIAHKLDVTNQAAVKMIFEKINAVDILVNCAGISHIGKADTTSEKDFDN